MAPPVPVQDEQGQEPDSAAVERLRASIREAEARDEAAATAVSEGGEETRTQTLTVDDEPDRKIFGFKDTLRGIFNGGVQAFNELTQFTNSATQWAAQKYLDLPERSTGRIGRSVARLWAEETEPLQIPQVLGETNTVIGGIASGVTQFGVGLVGTGKFVGAAKGASRLAQFANLTLRGAIVDATMFDPYEKTLAEIATEIGPEFSRELAAYLATDEEDSEAEARFKNAIEGAMLGGAIDGTLFVGGRIIRNLRKMRKAQLDAKYNVESRTPTPEEILARQEERFDIMDQPTYLRQDPDDIILPHVPGQRDPTAALADAKVVVETKGPMQGRHPMDEATFIRRKRQVEADMVELEKITKEADEAAGEAVERFGNRGDAMAQEAALSVAAKASGRVRGALDEVQLTQVKDMADMIAEETDPVVIQALIDNADFNFSYVQSTDEAKRVILAISEVLGKPLETRRLGMEPFEVTRSLGHDLFDGASREEAGELIAAAFGSTKNLPAIVAGARMYLHSTGKQVAKLAKRFELDPDNAAMADQLAEGIQHLFDVASDLAGTSSNIGRALNIHKLRVGADNFVDAAGRRVNTVAGETTHALTGLSKKEIHQLGRFLRSVDGDPTKILGMTGKARSRAANRAGKAPRFIDKFIEYMMNSMLSGPKTQAINILTTGVASAMRPMEMMLGGTLTRNPALRQEGWDTLVGLATSFDEAWRAGYKALRLGRNILDPESMVDDRAISQTGAIGGWMGQLIRLPMRFLMSGDEMLKQMNYRAHVRTKSLKMSRTDGVVDPEVIATRLREDMDMAFNDADAGIHGPAQQYSREQTFTNDLEYGWGASLQNLGREHPMFRVLCMPFVRTPANLGRWTWRHTPGLAMMRKDVRRAMAAGGEERAMAIAAQSAGLMIYGTAGLMAHNKVITGRGPSDPRLRELWLQNHQPYSVKIPGTDRWWSYRRADPILTPLGLVADVVNNWGEMEYAKIEPRKFAATVASALAANISNKTFLQGLTEFFEAVSSGSPHKFDRFLTNRMLTLVPFSSATRTATQGLDPIWREVEDGMDDLWKNIPGMSTQLPPSRNIFGEPILRPANFLNRTMNPFTVSSPLDDDVMEELILIGRGMSMPSTTHHGVDLQDRSKYGVEGQSPYDAMLELMATSGNGMPARTLREALTDLVRSDVFQNASGGTSAQPGGIKFMMVNSVINGYQDAALARMQNLPGYEQVRDDIRLGIRVEAAGKVGGDEGAAEAERSFLESLNNRR